jgi:hypothetical protein
LNRLTAPLENREKYSSAQIVAGSKHSSPIETRMWLPLHVDFLAVWNERVGGDVELP